MDYLGICQKVARESGTISGAAPTSVLAQTGRLLKVVAFVNDAWQQIQNQRAQWRWMQGEFSVAATIGTARYTATVWAITSFGEWITDTPEYSPVTLYDPAIGVADEGPLRAITYDQWASLYNRGAQENNRPIRYAISPANEFCLGPIPDKGYVVKGRYRKTNQVLAANTDIPNMPVRFHDLIVYRALQLLGGHDVAPGELSDAVSKALPLMQQLERDQLPTMRMAGGPLA